MLLCLAGICLQSGAVEDAAKIEDEGCLFEQKTRQTLESAKSKDWWGYYDFPRLSLKVFAHSAPNLKTKFFLPTYVARLRVSRRRIMMVA